MKTDNMNTDSDVVAAGRQAGVCAHISSLPGPHGIGDIADSSVNFLDTLVEMNIGVWQYLPTGPTAYGNSPYQPLSAFAGNPMLLGLGPLVKLGLLDAADLRPLEALPNAHVDFGALIPAKNALLEKAASQFLQHADQHLKAEYGEFLAENGRQWLEDYALFRVLKSLHGNKPWPEWEKSFVQRKARALTKIKKSHREALDQIKITQFLFSKQWTELHNAAKQKGIRLFGDMPIYIALDSTDAWSHPELLLIDRDGQPAQVAGVPPDYFSEDGQLWGNPIYNWAYHKQSGYRWWVQRMQHAAKHNDLVRIDHFRGFESYWSVPFGAETARIGEWVEGPGDALFDALRAALGSLPIVAENLGVITPQVEALRRNQNMPGMVVLQFELGNPEFDINSVEVNSVCYTGTHDNDTTVGWFQGSVADTRTRDEVVSMQNAALQLTDGTPDTIHRDIIRLAFSSQAALAIAPMQDYLGLGSESRLNIPGTTADNWRWRMLASQLDGQLIESTCELVRLSSR